jgi:hypothetical protein
VTRLSLPLRRPLLVVCCSVLPVVVASGALWLADVLRPREPPADPRELQRINEEQQRFIDMLARQPKPAPVPPDPLLGQRFPGTLRQMCDRKVEAYRRRYRREDWAANYYLAHTLIQRHEAEQLEQTSSATSWKPFGRREGAELALLLDRAAAAAKTAEERRRVRRLEQRAFEPPG